MKPNWNKPWDSGGEIGRLISPFKKVVKVVKTVGKQLSKKKRKKKAQGKK